MADGVPEVSLASRPSGVLPPPAPAAPKSDEKVMSLVDHLSELRRRLFITILSVVLGSLLGFTQVSRIIEVLKAPLGPGVGPLVVLGPADAFMINVKIALAVGLILAMPVLLFELWAFISPGLTPQERRVARPWVPLSVLFFGVGVAVAYFILPYASAFLLSFQSQDLKILIAADRYFDFVTTLFLAFGLVMEFPMVLVLLSKVGIITSKRLSSSRRMVILGITVFSALITPGGDLVSPIAMAITMYVLFEFSIVLVRAGGR